MRNQFILSVLIILTITASAVLAQDSLNVTKVGEIALSGARDVQIVGNYAYVAIESEGIRILDISNPVNPVEIGSCSTPGTAFSIAHSGDHLYVADGYSGLRIINVSDPYNPFEEGCFTVATQVVGIIASADLVYLSEGG